MPLPLFSLDLQVSYLFYSFQYFSSCRWSPFLEVSVVTFKPNFQTDLLEIQSTFWSIRALGAENSIPGMTGRMPCAWRRSVSRIQQTMELWEVFSLCRQRERSDWLRKVTVFLWIVPQNQKNCVEWQQLEETECPEQGDWFYLEENRMLK